MKTQKYIIIAFVLMVMVQIFVPANMIYHQEETLRLGKVYKFKTAPIDPSDPFRGKYIALDFEIDRVFTDAELWEDKRGAEAALLLTEDEEGYAQIADIKPIGEIGEDYIITTISYVNNKAGTKKDYVSIDLPFDRFYMEESKAYEAEMAYREAQEEEEAYALVRVYEGNALIEDVIIGGESVREVVLNRRTEKKEE